MEKVCIAIPDAFLGPPQRIGSLTAAFGQTAGAIAGATVTEARQKELLAMSELGRATLAAAKKPKENDNGKTTLKTG